MRTKILVAALLSSFASLSFAASNVTLYGQLDEGLVVGKAKQSSTTANLKSVSYTHLTLTTMCQV